MPTNLIPDATEVDFFWRILGFLSATIGLLSYLLSSSFHFIFGELNTWKTLLYALLIIIVPYSILFVKTWNPPQNLLFRSHLAFLVLLLASIYSYFYDKFMKIKPDVFSLVSTGSFAFTSLSLRMQNIQFGFEDDLLKFFLGFLTIQLMKINLLLTLIGAALCYFAIVLIPWCLDSPLETVRCISTLQENVAINSDTCASDLGKQLGSIQLGIVNDSENPERFVYPSDFESKLKDAIASGLVKECYMELENGQDPAKLAGASRGGLHPTNICVMNYLRAACQCRKQLERVFEGTHVSSLPSSSSSSSLSEQLLRIVDLLETNLEANSKIYDNDPALCSFVMMNNIRYIVQNAMNSELADLLGGDWLHKHILKVYQYHEIYQKSSWDRVLELLNVMDYDGSLVRFENAGHRFELFKLQFEKICENQSRWVICDDHLRNAITSSLRRTMLPAYENFMIEFLNDVETGDFGVPVIEGQINQLFLGKYEQTNPSNI